MSQEDRIKILEDKVQYLENIILKERLEKEERLAQKQKQREILQEQRQKERELKQKERELKQKEREDSKKDIRETKKTIKLKHQQLSKTLDQLTSSVFNDFHLNGNILRQGINGIVTFLLTGPLKNRYICIDPIHHVFIFRTLNDKVFQDIHASTMLSWFIQPNKDIIVEIINELKDITNDNCNISIANDLYDLLMGHYNKIFLQELSVATGQN